MHCDQWALRQLRADAFSSAPEQLGAFIHKDFAKWMKVMKDANVRVN